MTEFTLTAQRPALVEGFDNEFHILAKLKAPEQPIDDRERKPLNISLVIDRSGSMQGRPLKEAKKCACMIVNSLKSTDRVSVIAYDNRAYTYGDIIFYFNILNNTRVCSNPTIISNFY